MNQDEPTNDFEAASEGSQAGIVAEFEKFLNDNKKFWMIPLLVILALLGFLIVADGTAAAPFIYTLI
ncbi:MAG: hypothetical protein CMO80_09400 [Verrucomicrobiales bacterium]|nr:hypothetical protein [Verrucomicrobiales bacterium]|tara:strand:- start:90 stop:290 length:201 start_codon:yes stop_codon:yes gene_type:complete